MLRIFCAIVFTALLGIGNSYADDTALSSEDQKLQELLANPLKDHGYEKQLTDLTAKIKEAWDNNNYTALDAMEVDFRTNKTRLSDGRWYLERFYGNLRSFNSPMNPSDENWKAAEERMEKWMKENPSSPAAIILKGDAMSEHAWFFRGVGFSDSVSEDHGKQFDEYLDKTYKFMVEHQDIASVDPQWYAEMTNIGKGLGWNSSNMYVLLEEAAQKEPFYYPTYERALDFFQPKWGGSYTQIEQLARFELKKTTMRTGMGDYARLYLTIACCQDQVSGARNKMVWSDIETGFIDMLKLYPDRYLLNRITQFSCAARRESTTRLLMDAIKNDPDKLAWPQNEYSSFAKCKSWLDNMSTIKNEPTYDNSEITKSYNEEMKRALEGDAEAQFQMSQNYFLGQGVKADANMRFKWMLTAAQSGLMKAQRKIGYLYENDKGSIDQAIMWYGKAAEQGDIESISALGRLMEGKGLFARAAELYEIVIAKASLKDAYKQQYIGDAYSHLGSMLMRGPDGVEKDEERGLKLIRDAADNGSIMAASFLGWLYVEGQYTTQDFKEGYYWLSFTALLHGQPDKGAMDKAIANTNESDREGLDEKAKQKLAIVAPPLDADAIKAATMRIPTNMDAKTQYDATVKLAETGDAKAQYDASYLEASPHPWDGDPFTPHPELAAKSHEWLAKSADNGYVHAEREMGDYYMQKEPNLALAIQWYYKAAQQSDAGSLLALGNIELAQKHYTVAAKWYEFAIRVCPLNGWFTDGTFGGGGEAYGRLGGLLIMAPGGIPRDVNRGMQLLLTGSSKGSAYAMYLLSILYVKDDYIKRDYERGYFWFLVLTKLEMGLDKDALEIARRKLSAHQRSAVEAKVQAQIPKKHIYEFPKRDSLNITY